MRVLVSTIAGKGHFHPLAPLALALQARGHEVVVATGEDLLWWVRGCGLTARVAGMGEHDAARQAQREAPPGVPFGAYMFARIAAGPMLSDLRQLAEDWPPDMIVHEEAEYAAPLLAARLGVPCVTVGWPAPATPADARARAAEWLQPLWDADGIGTARTTGDVYLDCCPPALQTQDIEAVANVEPMRPELFDGPVGGSIADLQRLPRPLAYVTFGTVAAFAHPAALTTAASAAAAIAAAVVVTTGPLAPGSLGPLPENVCAADYLPQRQVLEHADVLISHGGAGSTLAGLLYGLPHLVFPQGAPSQQRCAEQIARLGAGLTLPSEQQTLANAKAAIHSLLTAESYHAAATAAAASLDPLPAVTAVAEDLSRRFA